MHNKQCNKCGAVKRMDDFPLSKLLKSGTTRKGDGRRNTCSACSWLKTKERREKWSKARKTEYAQKQQEYARTWDNKNQFKLKAIKSNARAKKMEVVGVLTEKDVEDAWFETRGKCWVCGFIATQIDHVQPINKTSGGLNVRSNIRPICQECNQKRSHRWQGAEVAKQEAKLLRQLKTLLNEVE